MNATAEDRAAQEYRRGREDAFAWACDYATPEEVRDVVKSFESLGVGEFDNPHWRGFVAAAEEVLDDTSPLSDGVWQRAD